MDNWFGATSTSIFHPFSISHLLMLAIAASGLFFLIIRKKQLRESSSFFSQLRWALFMLLLFSEISYQTWAISNDVWSVSRHIPLHLCGIASITAMIGLVTLHRTWIQISFFIGIFPAVLTLITPDLPYDFQHYRFWKFFIHHMSIPWACLFLALWKPSSITLRSVFMVYSLLLLYAMIIGFIVNPLTGSNYLYLSRLPNATTPLNFFGSGIWYYLNLGFTALLLFLGQYFLWRKFFINQQKKAAV
ncbi:YwaF family protein [Planococcus shenhongbingii]|uniref:TIGR02206 family membrane protein n=1 Tax=Planococcus shenhongbingii TaxID=3058398 RepID=A0ABT8NFZ2_9BACL|nr:TIGR02206 family membrane protein [Planococcus sp. N017]MDN7246819.1 TIGR02206 family membrane protein [Planococcus sp. N017]